MKALLAHIVQDAASVDRRRAARRTIRLDAPASSATMESNVVIRDLSKTGLLIESEAGFSVGETFLIVLPEIGATPARVKWNLGKRFGCEFLSPVTPGAISAAMLRTPFEEGDPDGEADVRAVMADIFAPVDEDVVRDAGWAERGIVIIAVSVFFTVAILAFLASMAFLDIAMD